MKRLGMLWSAALLALGIGLLGTPGTARAQDLPELSRDWNVRVGLFVATKEATRKKSGDVGFSGIVERRVHQQPGFQIYVGVGYNGFGDVYSVPVMVELVGVQHNLRYGGGAGYAFGKRVAGNGASGAALNLLLGYEFVHGKNPLSADMRYYFISGADNEFDGFSFTLGLQF